MLRPRKTRKPDRGPKSHLEESSSALKTQRGLLNDDVFLQPWFVPKEVYLQIRRLLPNIHLAKMRYYFEDYGCLKCGERKSLYGSNGLCERCNVVIRGRLVRSLKRRLKEVGIIEPTPGLSGALRDSMAAAQELLNDVQIRRFARLSSSFLHHFYFDATDET
jgi:hypothetical protein